MSSFVSYFCEEERDEFVQRRYIRDNSNLLELPDNIFTQYFRVTKDAFKYLLSIIEKENGFTYRSSSVKPIIKLSAALRFFAVGCYQTGGGNDYNVGVAQSTFSTILTEVINILEKCLCTELIKFPVTEYDKMEIKEYFYKKFHLPGVIGCIDGTHIKICSPSSNEKHLYYNRKGFYSLNAMLVCDHKMRITYINAKHPGACHDSFVFNCSSLDRHLEESYENGDIETWLLGDSGYALKPYLLTPYTNDQNIFNDVHSKARNIIERTIGVLKNRFRCILGERQLHYKPQKCVQIINVCCALHNLCIKYRVPDMNVLAEVSNAPENIFGENEVELITSSSASSMRDRILNSLLQQ